MAGMYRTFARLIIFLHMVVYALDVDFADTESIKNGAKTIADDLISHYVIPATATSGEKSGSLLPYPPYFWWESGAMWGVMLDYWSATDDSTYNDEAATSIQSQVGSDKDFMPADQSFDMGNDDQAFWALTAMTAAETNFQNPPPGSQSWLGLAQAVFNEQIVRWDNTTCGGGIHWQVNTLSGGYHLKNTISNGGLMQLAARLARYTKNQLYADWATKLWDWMWAVGLIDNENWSVYDNTDANLNCSSVDRTPWSYNPGTLLVACATMFNITDGDMQWKNRTGNILRTLLFDFFQDGIMRELCEPSGKCNSDEKTFKAYLSRWMAMTVQLAPFTADTIMPQLKSSAVAAMKQCSGTVFPNNCGLRWTENSTWDGSDGPGQQMAALEILISTLIKDVKPPLTNSTGGTSVSDPTAGVNKSGSDLDPGGIISPATHSDKVGAWFSTAIVILASIVGCYFLCSAALEQGTETSRKLR